MATWTQGKGGARWIMTPGGRVPSMSNKFGIEMRTIVLKNIKRGLYTQLKKIEGASEEALKAAAKFLKQQTETVPPTTPKDKGDLRKSFFAETNKQPDGSVELEIGYNAIYAMYVHEMTSPPYGIINWTEPGSGPKWFETHIQRSKKVMLMLVKAYVGGVLK